MLEEHYCLVGKYLGYSDYEAAVSVFSRGKRIHYAPYIDSLLLLLSKCPTAAEYEDWFAEENGPWGDEDPVRVLLSSGAAVRIDPQTFLPKELKEILRLYSNYDRFHQPNSSLLPGIWFSGSDLAEVESTLETVENKAEIMASIVTVLLRSDLAYLDYCKKRAR